jgi:hypothetical protein
LKIKLIIFVISVFAVFNCIAQLNGGFENWHDEYLYQVPDDWQTLNFLSIVVPPNPLSAFKATGIDKHTGNYALKLKTFFVNNNPVPDIIDDSVGLAFTGKVNYSPPEINFGFAYTGRPEKLVFWSKYMPVGNDTGGVIIVLQKWNGSGQDTIAYGRIYIPETPAYSLFEVSLTYYSSALPDTATIIFGASLKAGRTRVGSTIYIDDVAFSGWVGLIEKDLFTDKVKIFPNPAKESLTIAAEFKGAENVKIVDALGKTTGIYKIQNCFANVNTNLFVQGTYFYEICDINGNVFTRGKFNVLR